MFSEMLISPFSDAAKGKAEEYNNILMPIIK
jgi:hypothetical protein